jgi:hypothetical protein
LVFVQSSRYSCTSLMEHGFSRKIFEKYSDIKFHENPSIGNRVVHCGRTDGRTYKHDEANSHISNFADASDKMHFIRKIAVHFLRIVIDNNRCGSIVIVSNILYFLKVALNVHFCLILFSMQPPAPYWPILLADNKYGIIIGGGRLKCLETNLLQCQFVPHKFSIYSYYTGNELGPSL